MTELVAVKDLERFNEPEKVLEAVPETMSWPPVTKEPAVKELVMVADLERFNDPEKELEPVLVEV